MAGVTELQINGKRREVSAEPERSLLSVLRDDLELTGAKYGCGEGECGACTVLVDGRPVRSCRTRVGSVAGKEITTIEGLEKDGKLHPLQEAFWEVGAMQCGYCTCGMIMSGVALLRKTANPTPAEIVRAMDGNICRCGIYPRIIAAITQAAKSNREVGQ
jgi:aerobic-type carbon monoxide dehydrogenase small subunit (CoxS/CutS family)